MERRALLSVAYLAPIQYYTKLLAYSSVCVERCENYVKQTYRNRCAIAAANGVQDLSVPVCTNHSGHTPIASVGLSEHDHWRHRHWEALVSAYEQSPYFEFYADYFRDFYVEGSHAGLFDFDMSLLRLVCRLIGIDCHISVSDSYVCPDSDTDDYRLSISPKRGYAADKMFVPQAYHQVFERRYGFQPNLSIVDLLFNMGPESLLVIQNSIDRKW